MTRVRHMHRIRENYPTTCAALPVHSCEDKVDHVCEFKILRDLNRIWWKPGQKHSLPANMDAFWYGKEHPCRVHAQTSLPVLTRFQPVSSVFLLPNTARRDGFDGEATQMSQCLRSSAHTENKALPKHYKTITPVGHKPDMKAPFPRKVRNHTPDFVLTSVEISHTPKPTSVLQLHIMFSRTGLRVGRNRRQLKPTMGDTNPSWWINHAMGVMTCSHHKASHKFRGDA
ncbi:hypothetical protein VNO80_03227 [Phaseolus coccineus]|uniref:Uncharacterized protein n=1 Tax=Phaseolus coccineus TaxID=3886 RepID=A0AAN9RIM8_PHACN